MAARPGGRGPVGRAFAVAPGDRPDLAAVDTRARPVGPQDKAAGTAALAEVGARLDPLHRALWASGMAGTGDGARVLLVLQGVDTSGKGGAVRAVARRLDPQGVRVATFGKPTAAELEHDFLWRVRRALPEPGRIGLFDRSHYEDVLVTRVEALVDERTWRGRYALINDFEAELVADGVRVVKVLLALSPQEQHARLLARLDDPDSQWKYSPDDLRARSRWSDYQEAYADAIAACATADAPWHVVPADRKWYRSWVVASLLAETLADLDPQFPAPTYDVAAAREALLTADPLA